MRLVTILAVALVLFIALGIVAENRMAASGRNLTALLAGVERWLSRGESQAALRELHRFERQWAKAEWFWALITDHHEIDQIHLAIDRADKYLLADAIPDAQAELASLRFQISHIPKKEALGLRSVF